MKKRLLALLMVFAMVMSSVTTLSFAAESKVDYKEAKTKTESYMLKKVPAPDFGDEWYVIGLARGGEKVPQSYFDGYYKNLEKYIKECKGELSARKYTEYSRVILAVTAIGKDPSNVGGYNLLKKLADFDKVKWQGVNGPIWALIALDSGKYDIPKDSTVKKQSTRDNLIAEILRQEIPGGGFHLDETSTTPDPDMTGMAIQALAKYTNKADVKAAVNRAVDAMSDMQKIDGTFNSMNAKNVESSCQVITGLCALGIDAAKDDRFVRNGVSALDGMLSFYDKNGGFRHVNTATEGYQPVVNSMATEQGFYTLTAYDRMQSGKKYIYDMTDVTGVKPAVSKPAKVTVSSAKSLSSKALTVKWKKISSAKGYQVKYATSSKFTSAKTVTITKNSTVSKTIKNLKKGKYYYVKVRAYKTDASGAKVYGSYSTVKKVKVK